MANRVKGFDEHILRCAKEEFLDKGYEDASLRTISKNANVSTSTIYTRYHDKEGLFRALVEPAAIELLNYLKDSLHGFEALEPEAQKNERMDYTLKGYDGFLDVLYRYFDEFQLMTTSSTNGLYRYYLDQLVDVDVACTVHFLKTTKNPAFLEGRINEEFIHVISSAFYTGVFEIPVHHMKREDAKKYLEQLSCFYNQGWSLYLK